MDVNAPLIVSLPGAKSIVYIIVSKLFELYKKVAVYGQNLLTSVRSWSFTASTRKRIADAISSKKSRYSG